MINPIRLWRERRRLKEYCELLESNLWYLMGAPKESGFRGIVAAYPGIRRAAERAYAAGEKLDEETVRVAAFVLGDMILGGLSAEVRANILAALKQRIANSEARTGDQVVDEWVGLILVTENQAHMMVLAGRIEDTWRELLVSEIFGALRGKGSEERSHERLLGSLQESMFPLQERGGNSPG